MFSIHKQEVMSHKQVKYAELHCKSFYSFGQGASHIHELLAQRVGVRLPGARPDGHQPVRRAGVRPPRQQPRNKAHQRMRTHADRRKPPDAARQDTRGLRQHIAAAHAGERTRPPRAAPRSCVSIRACGRNRAAHRRARQSFSGSRSAGAAFRSAGAITAVQGLARARRRVHGTPAEFSTWGHEAQQADVQPRPRLRHPRGRNERRALPRAGATQAPARARRSRAQHDHRPRSEIYPAQRQAPPEIGRADAAAVSPLPRGAGQHPANRR